MFHPTNRPRPLVFILLLLLASQRWCWGADSPPNFVLIVTDDQSAREVSAYGPSSVATPNFDRIAREGVLFRNAYCSAPSCAPSRASILTGRNFWELEQGAFIQAWLPEKFVRFPTLLAEHGYVVGHTGKVWGPGVENPQGDSIEYSGAAWDKITRPTDSQQDGMSELDYAGNLGAFLTALPQERPFFFWVGIYEPHAPWGKDNFKKLGADLGTMIVPGFLPDTLGVRKEIANYEYEVKTADQTVGEIMRALAAAGKLENTVVMVVGDNGTPFPRAKASGYEDGVHVPLLVRWPGKIAPQRSIDDFVGFPDLAPTILELAGVPVPKSMSGRSITAQLLANGSGQIAADRNFYVTGLEWHGIDRPSRSIRDQRYHYIVNFPEAYTVVEPAEKKYPMGEFDRQSRELGVMPLVRRFPNHPAVSAFVPLLTQPPAAEELYDLSNDPWELVNLVADPGAKETVQSMRARMFDYLRQTNDPRMTGDMAIFDRTREFVRSRKEGGYAK